MPPPHLSHVPSMTATIPPHAAVTIIFFILSPAAVCTVSAQVGGSENPNNKYEPTTITPSMAIIIVVLIFAVFFMGIFSIYVRHCSDDGSHAAGIRAAVGAAVSGRSRRPPRGLPSDVLHTFPTFAYNEVKTLKFGKGSLECAVCLYEFEDDEKLRLLPKCDHVFHCGCIDAWLSGHSTCPVCRAVLFPDPDDHLAPSAAAIAAAEIADEVDSASVVDIPEQEQQVSSTSTITPPPEDCKTMPGRFQRSHSTGHSLGRPPETIDRFTLRLPEGVRAQLVNRGLNRVFPREPSSRRGYRGGEGNSSFGSGRRRYQRLDRPERGTKSDRWLLSVAPPFFSRVPSMTSPKAAEDGEETSLSSQSGRKTLLTAVRGPLTCLVAMADGDGQTGPGSPAWLPG